MTMARDLFQDVAILVLREPKLTGKPPGVPELNELGEPVYTETEILLHGYLMCKTEQAWKDNLIDESVTAVFICNYDEAIPAGSLVRLGDKTYHIFSVQYSRGLLGDGLTKIELSKEAI